MSSSIPVIDLFAGPGGLGEGFSAFNGGTGGFDVRLSIENDPVACETLKLRKFVQQFPRGSAPVAYYKYIQGTLEPNRKLLESVESVVIP